MTSRSGCGPGHSPNSATLKPVVLNLDNGIQVDAIAKLKPDLIVAVNAGLDAETYKMLSDIAPTIAQSGGEAFFEPWKDQAAAVATTVFKKDQMSRLVDAVDEKFAAVAQANLSFTDRTANFCSTVASPATPSPRPSAGGAPSSSTPWACRPGEHQDGTSQRRAGHGSAR